MLNYLEWTSGLSSERGGIFAFPVWIAWEEKNGCSEKSHVTFLLLDLPHCAYLPFLSFPLSPSSAFLTLDSVYHCSHLSPSCVFWSSPTSLSQFPYFPQQNIYSPVLLPLWLRSLLVCLSLCCFLNPFPTHPWHLTPVGSQNVGCCRCLFQGRQAPLLNYFLKM